MTKANATQDPALKRAPQPGGNFVKIAVGHMVKGVITEARMELQKSKDKKGKETSKERYHFSLRLAEDTALRVGKKKQEKDQEFKAGDIVTLPDHGFLTATFRRTACEIAGVPYVPNEDTDLTPLVGAYFEITRREDGEIVSGEFAGTASALYDVFYKQTQE